MSLACLFPGQGSQYVEMGKNLLAYPEAAKVFAEADRVLGFPLTEIIFSGPEDKLRQTPITQPAILTVSIAYWQVASRRGLRADVCAGHSLGEYSALVASGSLTFEDAVMLVHRRGQYMQEAASEGSMMAVLGLERDVVEKLCQEAGVQAANYNSPGQIVVAGLEGPLSDFADRAKEAGAKRVVPLKVSGPFHSSYQQPAAEKLARLLEEIEIKRPQVPVIANATSQILAGPDDVRDELIQQLTSPVYWEDSVQKMFEMGVSRFIEVGPGKVLAGLVKRTARAAGQKVTLKSVDADLESILQEAGD